MLCTDLKGILFFFFPFCCFTWFLCPGYGWTGKTSSCFQTGDIAAHESWILLRINRAPIILCDSYSWNVIVHKNKRWRFQSSNGRVGGMRRSSENEKRRMFLVCQTASIIMNTKKRTGQWHFLKSRVAVWGLSLKDSCFTYGKYVCGYFFKQSFFWCGLAFNSHLKRNQSCLQKISSRWRFSALPSLCAQKTWVLTCPLMASFMCDAHRPLLPFRVSWIQCKSILPLL